MRYELWAYRDDIDTLHSSITYPILQTLLLSDTIAATLLSSMCFIRFVLVKQLFTLQIENKDKGCNDCDDDNDFVRLRVLFRLWPQRDAAAATDQT